MPLRAATHENASFVARQSLISISFLLTPCQPFHGMQRDIPEFFNRLLADVSARRPYLLHSSQPFYFSVTPAKHSRKKPCRIASTGLYQPALKPVSLCNESQLVLIIIFIEKSITEEDSSVENLNELAFWHLAIEVQFNLNIAIRINEDLSRRLNDRKGIRG